MSQVPDFHMHDVVVDGVPARVTYPSAVYDCPEEQCSTERAVIRRLARWPMDTLDAHIAAHEDRVNKTLDMLMRLRDARELKRRDGEHPERIHSCNTPYGPTCWCER